MILVLLTIALCAGLTTAAVSLTLGGSFLTAFVVYVVSGHILMASILGYHALRSFK